MEDIQLSLFGRMCPEPSPATKEKTSESFYRNLSGSSSRKPLCLKFQKGGGTTLTSGWATSGALLTELSTLSTGEYPNADVESTLFSILEVGVPEKYYLSRKACEGILRRAEKREKELPQMLKDALMYMIATA